jgi:hypothetical protein
MRGATASSRRRILCKHAAEAETVLPNTAITAELIDNLDDYFYGFFS